MENVIEDSSYHQREELSLSECNLMEVGTLHYVWNLSSLLRLYLRNCNLMEGEIPNHIWHLSSLEELYLDGNHFSSLPAGINRLTNLRVLDLSHCKNLQQIPELPSSLRFLDAHCSGGISSSPSPLPIHSMVNCFKPEIPVWFSCQVPFSFVPIEFTWCFCAGTQDSCWLYILCRQWN